MSLETVFDRLVEHWVATIVFCLVVAGGLAAFVDPEIDTSLRIWFLDGDPDVATYDDFIERFETDEFIAVAIEADDVFAPEVLANVERVSDALAEMDDVITVRSLTTVEEIRSDGTTLTIDDLIRELPESDAEAAALRAQVLADELLSGLVSDEGTATIIMAEHTPFEDLADKAVFAASAREIIGEALDGQDFRLAGNALVDEAMQKYTKRDLSLMAPMTLLMIVIVTFGLFRSFWCTVIPTAVVGFTLASTVGVAGMLGVKLNMITTIVIPLSMAVGIADSVHIIAGYRERLQAGIEQMDALRGAWVELLFPCVVTTLTTAAGLASLLSTQLKPLREFGWMGGITVFFALFYTMLLIPPILSRVAPPVPTQKQVRGPVDGWLAWMADTSWKHHKVVLFITGVFVSVSVWGVTRLETGADFVSYFKDSEPLIVHGRFVDEHLGGTGSIDIIIESDDIREPAVLQAMEDVQHMLEDNGAIVSTSSPASLVATLHERYTGNPERNVIPDTLPAAAQLFSLTEGSTIHEQLMELDYGAARIRARVRASDYATLLDSVATIEAQVESRFEGVADAQLTGVGKLVSNLDIYIVESQIRSFILAFAMVAVLLAAFFRSFHIGAWALVPNALPILLVLGIMGWSGIALDVGTVMIASIMLGLIVDDTVHYLARYRLEFRKLGPDATEDDYRLAARHTGMGTGKAIGTTSIILVCAFWLALGASFKPNINFGLMCGIATIAALICDLLALPAVIRLWPMRARG